MPDTSDAIPLRTFRIRQRFELPRVIDLEARVFESLSRLGLGARVRPGHTVAITAGSRGITDIHRILKATSDFFKSLKARPIIVAAMGSHGGATADGQERILGSYGIAEAFCGCPIRTSMETVVLGHSMDSVPIHFASDAAEAEHVFLVGRVKPHPTLAGEYQSGLMKMMLIGLGKHNGALAYHHLLKQHSFDEIVRCVAPLLITKGHILGGLAIVENACSQTAFISGVPAEEIEVEDKRLLSVAVRLMPRLPFRLADLLLIDEIGKDISGSGMDTNVVGRKHHNRQAAADEFPKVKRIIVRDLSRRTQGNATGLNKADFCLSRVVRAMDRRVTQVNMATAGYPTFGMIPPHYETDREVLDVALRAIGQTDPARAGLLWIPDTRNLTEVECAESYRELAQNSEDLEVLTDPRPLVFDDMGCLPHSMQCLAVPSVVL